MIRTVPSTSAASKEAKCIHPRNRGFAYSRSRRASCSSGTAAESDIPTSRVIGSSSVDIWFVVWDAPETVDASIMAPVKPIDRSHDVRDKCARDQQTDPGLPHSTRCRRGTPGLAYRGNSCIVGLVGLNGEYI